ncbi:MAG: hypothetical protein M1818_002183 [Claussenomyces sp. TS43310]|nr:MAG: hypothetical protein M1818_002183 [Claussenomyces sp. TS43310]
MEEPIAIIGMSGRYPQDSTDNDRFWQNLLRGRSMMTTFPKDKLDMAGHYHPDPEHGGSFANKGGHFLSESSADFDAPFFSVTKNEVMAMDPQQRILMENVYSALENLTAAGIPMSKITGSQTSVFVGAFMSDFLSLVDMDNEMLLKYKPVGTSNSILSNRVSWFYDLQGGSLTLDTACSSSLVAFHLACQSLRNKESEMSIISGVSVVNYPTNMYSMSNIGFLSPDGKSYSFDHRANGYSRGEGVGTIIIKPLSAAIRDGDTVRAVVRATGINQDGRTPGITLPSKDAQERLIRETYAQAGLDVADTAFVEAHGTGTAVGDPIEAGAIANAFKSKDRESPLYIGAVKSHIGHLEGASGVASLMKSVLILESATIPPNINFERVNPKIPMDKWNIKFPVEPMPWPAEGIRRASINSFGFGGTNAHVVLDDAYNFLQSKSLTAIHRTSPTIPGVQDIKRYIADHDINDSTQPEDKNPESGTNGNNGTNGIHSTNGINGTNAANGHGTNGHGTNGHVTNGEANGASHNGNGALQPENSPEFIFVWSSFDEQGVKRIAKSYADFLRSRKLPAGKAEDTYLRDLTYTLLNKRTLFPWKSFAIANSMTNLIENLDKVSKPVRVLTVPNVAFVFTGQGAQWYAMGRELCVYPVFQQSLDEASKYMKSLGSSWTLTDELAKDKSESIVDQPTLSHPSCTALQVALVDLLASWAVLPVRAIGHSSGEIAAAYCAGSISREAAWRIAYFRGYVSAKQVDKNGAMLAVGLTRDDLLPYLNAVDSEVEGVMSIACFNSPKNLTVSGDDAKINKLKESLDKDNVFARKLKVRNAYHSAHMDTVAQEYLELMGDLKSAGSATLESKTILFSSVIGQLIDKETVGKAEYWVQNMVSPVRFSEALLAMCQYTGKTGQRRLRMDNDAKSIPVNEIVEVGPHTALQSAIKDTLATEKTLDSIGYHGVINRNITGVATILRTVGQLFTRGLPVDINVVNEGSDSRARSPQMLINLPSYKFNHTKTYWPESRFSKNFRMRKFPRHDLFGAPVSDWDQHEPRWRQIVRVSENPWLNDHKVTGSIVYPGVGYLIMAIEAAKQISKPDATPIGFQLKDISIKAALVVPDTADGVEVVLSLHRMSESSLTPSSFWSEFRVVSYNPTGDSWVEHCTGLVGVDYKTDTGPIDNGREAKAFVLKSKDDLQTATKSCQQFMDIEGTYDELATIGLNFGPLFKNLSKVTVANGIGEAMGVVTVPDVASCMPKHHAHPHLIHPATMDSMLHLFLAAIMDTTGGVMLKEPMLPVFIRDVWVSADVDSHAGHEFRCHGKATKISHNKYQADINVWDGVEDAARITIKGLQSIPLQSSSVSATTSRKIAYSMDWKPDVDLLDSASYFVKNANLKENKEYSASVKNLQLVSMLLITRGLQDFNGEVSQPHLQKYLEWLKYQSGRLDGGTIVHQDKDWQQYFDDKDLGDQLIERIGGGTEDGQLLVRMGKEIAPILRGDADPLHLLFDGPLLDKFYRHNFSSGNIVKLLSTYLETLGHNQINLKVLEIGAGTGGTTLPILEALNHPGGAQKIAQYTFTDISAGFFEKARDKFKDWLNVLKFNTLDIEKDPASQGLETGTYDIIVAGNVLHATADLSVTLSNARSLLKPGGKLILDEGIQRDFLWVPVIFGLVPGWWLSVESNRQWGPLISEPEWDAVLNSNGFSGNDLLLKDNEDFGTHGHSMIISTAVDAKIKPEAPETFIVVSSSEGASRTLASLLEKALTSQYELPNCKIVEYTNLKDFDLTNVVCVSLLGLQDFTASDLSEGEYTSLRQLLATSGGLVWVTDDTTNNPGLAMATGLVRTMRWERDFVGLNLVTLGFENPRPAEDVVVAKIAQIFSHQFINPTPNKNAEYIYRDDIFFTNRVVDSKAVNDFLEAKSTIPQAEIQQFGKDERALKLSTSSPGLLNKLEFVDDLDHEKELRGDQVEVEIKASGLNFRDIMVAMGEVPNTSFGDEGAGIVSKVGSDVTDIQVGDRVLIVNVELGTFQTYTRATRDYVAKIPDSMSFEVAAGIPVIYCTAIYCLYEIGRLSKGETILIHAAAGGMGQASIMLAKLVGAEIFATVSTNEKKALLVENYGIPEDHIFSSRDLSFAKGIMRATNGRGVDVIINSLAGEALRRSWDCIAHFGRFIEIGKKDIYANGRLEMFPFSRSVLYAGVDFATVVKLDPKKTARLIGESLNLFSEDKVHTPLPYSVFDYSQTETAFRLLQSGKGMGKIILKSNKEDLVPVVPRALVPYEFETDATYVLAGGTGGIGRSIARWMISRGAKHLVLLSRSGDKTEAAQQLLAEMNGKGCSVKIYACDVSDKDRLAAVLQEVSETMPPIKGCVQGSMQLRDAMFENMTYEDFQAAIRPRVHGSWNLHNLLPKSMSFFIFLSSICSVLGIRGQANYCAGNTYQDALAEHRMSQGLPATSLDLGNILSVGYVAERREQASFSRLFSFVLDVIREDELHALIEYHIDASNRTGTESNLSGGFSHRAQVVTGLTTSETYRQKGVPEPSYMANPLFTQLRATGSSLSSGDASSDGLESIASQLRTANSLDAATALIADAIVKKLSYIMIIPTEEIDPQRSISSYGVDSLVAMELRSWFGKDMGADIQILDLMGTSSILELSKRIAGVSTLVKLSVETKVVE